MVFQLQGKFIIHGLIYPGYGNATYEALLVEGGVVRYLGSLDHAARMAGGDAVILDYEGRLVTPGLIDSHCHLSVAGLYLETGVSLLEASSLEEVKDIVRREAYRRGEDEWIYGFGLDESRFKERRLPTRWDLDDAAPSNPVVLEHISGHLVVANSRALELSGISSGTPDPPGGAIDRDAEGSPTGVLRDNAMSLVLRLLPPTPPSAWVNGIRRAQRLWLEKGFTAAEDAGTFGAWSSIIGAYRRLRRSGELLMRVRVAYAAPNASELSKAVRIVAEARRMDDDHLRTNLVKAFYDGSGLAGTALLYDDWCRDHEPRRGDKGLRVLTPQAMEEVFRETIRADARIAVHAIGDRAVDEVLEAYAAASGGIRVENCSASIVHALLISSKGFKLLEELGMCIKTQPGFMYTHGHVYSANFCSERSRHSFPLRSLLRRGIVASSGTDAPFVGSPNPVEGLYGAVYRQPRLTAGKSPFGSEETVSFLNALETYTRLAAASTGWIDVAGTLEPGKKADIVVWSIGSIKPSREEMLGMKPLAVFIGGSRVYSPSAEQ